MTYAPGTSPQGGQSVLGGYIPGVSQLAQFQVNWDQWETIKQSLYDSAVYATAGQSQLLFFSVPIGGGTSPQAGSGGKTVTDTNMALAGQIPANQMFLIQSFEIEFLQATPATTAGVQPSAQGAQAVATQVNDAWYFRRGGSLQFVVGSKPYLTEAPLLRFPPKNRFNIQAALSDSTTAASAEQGRLVTAEAIGRPYIITPANILLIANQNFSVTLLWQEGAVAITTAAIVKVIIDGFLYRRVQ